MNRRQFLRGVGIASIPLVAGCSEGGPAATTTTGEEDGNPFGSSDGGDTTTATPPGGGGAGGGGGTATATPTATPGDTTTETAEWTATDTQSAPTLGDVEIAWEGNYRFRLDYNEYEARPVDLVATGAWHGRDFYSEMSHQGTTSSVYEVGGTTYLVAAGHCSPLDGAGSQIPDVNMKGFSKTEEKEAQLEQWSDLQATGTTTFDGETVWVFTVEAGARGNEYPITYYVSTQTNYVRRVEVQGIVVEYWDWGNVGPISAPC